jgi:hypothetical protein
MEPIPSGTSSAAPVGGKSPDPRSLATPERRFGGRIRRMSLRRRLLAAAIAMLVTIAVLAGAGFVFLLSLPGVGGAEAQVRAILAAHGGVAAPLPPPAKLGRAVVEVEDENFYANVALNILDGAGRAGLATLQTSGDPGGSTIGQQLAKRLYPHGGGLGGTLEEIGIAVKLSLRYSKAQILNMYLNSVYYGNGYWGDVAAAHGYFGDSVRHLTWSEATLLAGLPQAPSAYDPFHHPALARQRQRHVLDQLVDNGFLSEGRAAAIFRQPLALRQ